MTSIAAVDMALWDIKAKTLNVPLYQLLGGKSREKVLVYCHANGTDPHHTLEEVEKHIEMGYKAIRVQSGIPGMRGTYGVAKKGEKYGPATPGLPQQYEWTPKSIFRLCPVFLK
jgi:mannonate dehydratase